MKRFVLIALILIVVTATGAWWSGRGDGRTHLIVPAVRGDAILIRTADGATVLIDGGSDGAATVAWLGRELPFWQRRLDLLVLTRSDDQTLPGQIAVLRRYAVDRVAYVLPRREFPQWTAWRDLAKAGSTSFQELTPGRPLPVGAATLTVLSANDGRAALEIKVGQMEVLALQSSLESDANQLVPLIQRPADLVLFPWLVRPSQALAEKLRPRALIYTAAGDTPLQQTWHERWQGVVPLYHPAVHGRIDWSTDGRVSTIEVERRP